MNMYSIHVVVVRVRYVSMYEYLQGGGAACDSNHPTRTLDSSSVVV